MQTTIGREAAALVLASRPSVEAQREKIEKALADHMAWRGPFDPSKNRYRVTTAAILDMLLEHARRVSVEGDLTGLPELRARHRRMAIEADHYSAFGDGLPRVLKETLGPQTHPDVLAAWKKAYRAISDSMAADPIENAA